MVWPRIPSPDPVTLPATGERTYSDLFVTGVELQFFPGVRAMLGIQAHNYNHDTDELLQASRPVAAHRIDKLGAEMQRIPMLDTAVRQMVHVSALVLREGYLVDRIRDLDRAVDELDERIDHLTGRIDELAGRIADLDAQLALVAEPSERAALEAEKAVLEARKSSLEGRRTALQDRKAALQGQEAPLFNQLSGVRTQLGIE
jgi:chromosome segregation ATPase